MSAKGQILRRASQGGYYALPKDFRRPPHLQPKLSLFLSALSAALFASAFYYVWFLWLACIPLQIAVKGRKDKGVFLYGFITGGLTSAFFFKGLGAAAAGSVISFAVLLGFWLWLSRKVHNYLTFPDARTAVAGVAAERFILEPGRQAVFSLVSAVIFTALLFLCREISIITPSFKEHDSLTTFFGAGSTLFLCVLLGSAVSSFLEYRMASDKLKPSLKVPICSVLFIIGFTLLPNLHSYQKSSRKISLQKISFEEFRSANRLLFIDTAPLLSKIENFKTAEPIQPDPVNQYGNLGVLPNADAYFPYTVRNLIRDGADLIIAEGGFPGVGNEMRKRCLEFGVSGLLQNKKSVSLISCDGIETAFTEGEFKAEFNKTFFSFRPSLFRSTILSLFCLVLLTTAVHVVNRRKTLYSLLVRKTI